MLLSYDMFLIIIPLIDAPSFMWDEKKKPVHIWDGSIKNSKTLDYLLQDTGRGK